jgi:hypothetical protein
MRYFLVQFRNEIKCRKFHGSTVTCKHLPLVVDNAEIKIATLAVSNATTHLHRLEISNHIINMAKKRSAGAKDHLYTRLLRHVDLHDASILSQSNELLCESISKSISLTDPVTHHTCKINFKWNCERHNNPHMDINEYESYVTAQFSDNETVDLFKITRYDEDLNASAIQRLFDFLSVMLDNVAAIPANSCEGHLRLDDVDRKRDMGWFLTFLCCHPSDNAFDVASMYLMPQSPHEHCR